MVLKPGPEAEQDMQGKQQRTKQVQLRGVGCSGGMPALLSPSNPWVAMVSMEKARPFKPPRAENILGEPTLLAPPGTFTALLAGAELIPHISFKPEPELIVKAHK